MISQTGYHLASAIFRWIGAKPNQYALESKLRDMWDNHFPSVGYEPEGIRRLHSHLGEDPFFGSCHSFQSITPGELVKGGDLQTVGQLFGRLQGCEQSFLLEDFAKSTSTPASEK